MENKINVSKQESLPSNNQNDQKALESISNSAATHLSVRARNLDDLCKRIRSGNDVLCRLPFRLDPNIQFSEDEDEEELDEEIENENKVPEGNKTPKFRSRTPPMRSKTSCQTSKPPSSSFDIYNKQWFSAYKPSSSVQRSHLSMQHLVPQSENKVRSSTSIFPENPARAKMNLMSQSEFKAPFKKPIPKKNPSPLSDDIIVVNNKSYSVLSLLGTGGSCKVFSVFDIEKKILVAVKCVDLKNIDPSIREGYKKEIEYLKKLQNSNRVIKMYDFEYRKDELFVVLERGEVDFAKYISNQAKMKSLTPLMIKFYWAQMLEAVGDIHKYGIVHSDLKPANFLLVSGNLKLIDFGIAASVPDDKTSTFRDTQVGTLNYMSPEAITQLSDSEQRFKVGVKSDVWSLGCILYNLVYGMSPFQNVRTLMQKIYAITNPNYEIIFKPLSDKYLLDVLKSCLKRNPKERASVEELLNHPYLKENEAESKKSTEENPSSDLNNFMAQMQILTPRRMNYLSRVLKDLSEKHN
ncbi:hypothetical protein CDAR_213901 [Caerostris darwini]|uniref:Protein kinase domain-containing protein n=1 Tax=Caerostris darwini TaxID=1538125 RepID=A0AAV4SFJ7_9ARAC|nr:hypothetical protein CDAR_213901 [Caerostris darwini]